MQKSVIANFIKQLRKTSGLSTDEVTTQLNTYGISISSKTLYGYENGTSMLNADVFVALCRIYKCDNPMNLFGNSSIKSYELKALEKYRDLDPHGKEMVDIVLQKEWERSTLLKPAAISSVHIVDEPELNAAHERPNASLEDQEADNALMDDENF